jgi:ABC-2 type transport system ATP-binding protein
MDPESARLVRDEISRLKSSQRTIVICSHNLTEAEALADKIAIIYRGRILLQGSLEELKRDVLGLPEYEIKFTDAWDSSRLEMPEGVESLSRTATSLKVRVERPQASNPMILKALSDKSAPVMAFQEEARTLEQVYLKVMAEAKGRENVQ